MYAPAPNPEILAEFARRVDAVTADRKRGSAQRDAALIDALRQAMQQKSKTAETPALPADTIPPTP